MNFASNFAYVASDSEDISLSEDDLDVGLGEVLRVHEDDDEEDDVVRESEEKAAEPQRRLSGGKGGPPAAPPALPQQQQQPPQPQKQGLLAKVSNAIGSVFSSAPPPPQQQGRKHKKMKEKKAKKVLHRKADTNVVAVKFGSLAQDGDDIFAGDPVFCKECGAALSNTSKITPKGQKQVEPQPQPSPPKADAPEDAPEIPGGPALAEDDEKRVAAEEEDGDMQWSCEFCDTVNIVDIEPEEIPKSDARDYVLAPAAAAADESKQDAAPGVIFCIDTSGSMCVTKEVPGTIKLRGPEKADSGFGVLGADDVRPRQGRQKTTWVSRLQCVQAAVDQQLSDWSKKAKDRKVGIVTFSRDVTIVGDGRSSEVIAGDKLNNDQELQQIGAKHSLADYQPISESYNPLSKKLFELEENGPTALGPALLISVAIASKTPGSRVVVCTDGLANVGIGSLDTKDDEQRQKVEQWYDGVGQLAKLAGVTVSVISIKGDECALEDLGRVAELSGGNVDRVEPLDLTKNFSTMLDKPIIASQVTATLMLHSGLKFRNEKLEVNKLVREIGNVTEDTEITFEYTVKSKKERQHVKSNLKELPFQLQIHFTKLDGMKCLRILSRSQPITSKREEAEKDVKLELLAANVAQQSAALAEQGNYLEARAHNRAWGQVMARSSAADASGRNKRIFKNWLGQTEQYDAALDRQQAVKEVELSESDSDSEDESAAAAGAAGSAPRARKPSSLAVSNTKAKMLMKKRKAKSKRSDQDYTENRSFAVKSSTNFL